MNVSSAPTPERILALSHGFWATQIVSTAADCRFFTLIAEGHRTAEAVAEAAGTDLRGTRMILDALVALDLLFRRNSHYVLAQDAEAFLVEGQPQSLAAYIAGHPTLLWDDWGRLRETVRSGRRAQDVGDAARAQAFFPKLIQMIMPLGLGAADAAASHFGVGRQLTGVRVLDVGAGGAAWSIPFARLDGASEITALDRPDVLKHTGEMTARFGVGERYRLQPGDYRRDDFGEDEYDFVLFGNICHGESPEVNRTLFAKTHRALKPGGRALIGDMLRHDDRTGPPMPAMFALNMYLHNDGDTYSLADYREWLTGSGFADVSTLDTGRSASPIVVGTK
ncbi:MAG TPA: methyltransferase dimerization domain-containing protein [Vicinamibacterales bacterium]|nr:methyltransferase dimerization domain-containing protein [Vicinamibacterales bacterium]